MTTTYISNRVSVNDYPEHLNPFFEDDNHNRIRFWTKTKKLVRSNSFTFSGFNEGFKELRNSIRRGVSRSRRGSTVTSKESSPVVLRRTIEDPIGVNEGSERLLNEHGFVIPFHERHSYRYKSLTPSPKPKFNSSSDDYFTLPVRTHRFRPEATSTPRKATSVCDHRASQQPFALPGLTHTRKLSTSSLSPFESERTGLTHRRVSSTSIAGGESLTRKKRKAPLPPNIKVTNGEVTADDSGFRSLNSTQDASGIITTLLITEDDLRKSVIDDPQPDAYTDPQPEVTEEPQPKPDESLKIEEDTKLPEQTLQVDTETIEQKIEVQESSPESVEISAPSEEGHISEEIYNNEINNNIEVVEQISEVQREVEKEEQVSEDDEIEEQITKYIDENNDEYSIEHLRKEVNNLCADIELRTREAKSVKDIVRDINRRTAEESRDSMKQPFICEMDTRMILERNGHTTESEDPISSEEPFICEMDTRLVPQRNGYNAETVAEEQGEGHDSSKELLRKDSRLILEQNGHLAKEEEYDDDIKPEPTPLPRVKKEKKTETNGSTDLTKPNPIPKPKRSKLFTKIAKVFK